MALNIKEELFAKEFIANSGNACKAAIKAGYSEKTARYAAKWLKEDNPQKPTSKYKPELAAFIKEKLKEIHNEKTADDKEVMEYLTSVMRGESKAEIVVVENVGDYTSEARRIEKSPDEKEKLKAAEILAKILGITTTNFNINGNLPVVISGGDELED